MVKQKISIFCQAPGDVIHTLALYHKYKNKADISIYCINVKSIFEYLKSLNLELTNFEFIPYDIKISIKNPFKIISARRKLANTYKNLFADKKNETVYFFAIWFDWIAFYFLNRLNKTNHIIYYKHYLSISEKGKSIYNLKEKVNLFYYYLLTNIHLQYTSEDNIKRLLFPYQKFGITSQEAINIKQELFSSFLYKIKDTNKKSILFFETNLIKHKLFTNYVPEITDTITHLQQKGYSIFIKGHPSLGTTMGIQAICNHTIAKEIPAELIDINQFCCVIGTQSFSMAYFATEGHLVYSLIDLLSFSNNSDREMYRDYLNKNSNHKIKFPKNISEICS